MLKTTRNLIFLFILFFTTIAVNAQIVFDDDVEDVPAAPIDGFVGIAIVAGAAVGFRKSLQKNNRL